MGLLQMTRILVDKVDEFDYYKNAAQYLSGIFYNTD